MPVITLVSMSGPHQVQADPISGSPDGLVVVRKWREDPHAFSVAAPIPGTDAWMSIATRGELSHPNFPHGKVRQSVESMLAGLPAACEEYSRTTRSILAPALLGVAQYLGILTADHVAAHRALVAGERSAREASLEKKLEDDQRSREQQLARALEAFRGGEMISASDFEGLLSLANISLPARTLSTLRTRVTHIGRNGVRLHGGKLPDGIWRAVQQLWSTPQ
jgi:hypothetical protein